MVEIVMLGVASIILLILYLFFVVLSPEKREAAQNEGLEDFKKWSARRHEEWKKTGKRAYPGYWITAEGPVETAWREDLDAPADLLKDYVDDEGYVYGYIDGDDFTKQYLVLPVNAALAMTMELASSAQGFCGMVPPGSALIPLDDHGKWRHHDGTPWTYETRIVTTLDVNGVVEKRASDNKGEN